MKIVIFSCLIILILFSSIIPGHSNNNSITHIKKKTWSETMKSARAQYSKWYNENMDSIKPGIWYVTKAMRVKSFEDKLFPERKVDLTGKKWKPKPEWIGGVPYNLP